MSLKSKTINITGARFGKLVVQRLARTENWINYWECQCDCGNVHVATTGKLRSGHTKSCGCYKIEWGTKNKKTHGYSNVNGKVPHEYYIWASMKSRCNNPNNPKYKNYGGRGIIICGRWLVFENFLADMGSRPSKDYRLERIDNNGNYEPSNCKWATHTEQARNRRDNRVLEFKGETKTLAEWAEILGIKYGTLNTRLNKLGWSIEEAFTAKVGSGKLLSQRVKMDPNVRMFL